MDKNNIYLFVLLILSLVVTVTVTSALMLIKKANNQEFKERTVILFMEDKDSDGTLKKQQYTIVQLRKTKIEIETCEFTNNVKIQCEYDYPEYNNRGKKLIDVLDELKIPPGETIINLKEEIKIAQKFFSSFEP